MRDPTQNEAREILQELADDGVHSTTDLFPGLQGDNLIGPSELIVRMGQCGYLTHGRPYITGANEIARGVPKIRITPEGHHWLETQATAIAKVRTPWSRGDRWTALGVIVAILAIIISLFVPEVRRKIGLEKPDSSVAIPGSTQAPPSKASGPANTTGADSPAITGDGNTIIYGKGTDKSK